MDQGLRGTTFAPNLQHLIHLTQVPDFCSYILEIVWLHVSFYLEKLGKVLTFKRFTLTFDIKTIDLGKPQKKNSFLSGRATKRAGGG